MNDNKREGRWRRRGALLCLAFSVGLVGCGGTSLAPVTGKVTCNGEPVKGGMLLFSPSGSSEADATPGKPASAVVQPDGSYTVGTNGPSDGAIIGRHRVTYTPSPPPLTEEQAHDYNYKAPPPPYRGLVPKPNEVEVKAGSNTIDFELVAAPPQ